MKLHAFAQCIQKLVVFPDLEMVNVYGVEVPGADGRAGMAALLLAEGARFDPEAFFRDLAAAQLGPGYGAAERRRDFRSVFATPAGRRVPALYRCRFGCADRRFARDARLARFAAMAL